MWLYLEYSYYLGGNMASSQHIFKSGNSFFLVDMWEDGKITLKVKEQGWSDVWSLSLDECDNYGNTKEKQ
jgi:hypothetical protein